MTQFDKKGRSGGGKSDSQSVLQQSPPPTWLSWGIRGLSLAIIVSLIAYLVYDTVRPVREPVITFTIIQSKIESRGGGWALPVSVTNAGTEAVHALKINAALTQVQGKPSSTLTVLILGPNEEVTATFWFSEDPRGKGPEFFVESYLNP